MPNRSSNEIDHDQFSLAQENSSAQAVLAAAPVAPREDHEESIEDYMAALLNRVRRKANGEDVELRPAPTIAAEAAHTSAPVESVVDTAPPSMAALPPPVRVAPPIDLATLREVSKSHSELLFSKHQLRQHKTATSRHGLVAATALAAGTALTLMSSHLGAIYLPGIICFAVAIVWGIQFAGATFSLSRTASAPPQND